MKKSKELDFPNEMYITFAILSIIYKYENNLERAEYYKKLAEETIEAESSGFKWHKKLGLVENRNKLLDELIYK
ncbi:MAG: hypothetical protein LBC74_15135 [Planctomycetaceae bacterium]|nr:hypothetical protein [Planctomycetaceae bacterium]